MNPTNETGYPDGISCHVFMADDQAKEHAHREIELIYNLEETIIVSVEDAAYRMGQDDILLVNAGKRHSVRRPAGSRKNALVCCIHLSERLLSEYTGQYRLFSGVIR